MLLKDNKIQKKNNIYIPPDELIFTKHIDISYIQTYYNFHMWQIYRNDNFFYTAKHYNILTFAQIILKFTIVETPFKVRGRGGKRVFASDGIQVRRDDQFRDTIGVPDLNNNGSFFLMGPCESDDDM